MARTASDGDRSRQALRRADLSKVHLGRRPFKAAIEYYAAFQESRLSHSTLENDLRKLRMFAEFFEGADVGDGHATTDPRHMDEATVNEFLIWMKDQGLMQSTAEGYLKVLNRMLSLFGNHVVDEMRRKPWVYRLPKAPRDVPINALSRDDLQRVMDATYNLTGWSGDAFRGMLALSFATAARPSEALLALYEDLDLEGRSFFIRHPKGEDTWGVPQKVAIVREDVVPMIEDFLAGRDRMMDELGVRSEFLFVNPATGLPYSDKTMRAIKRRVQDLSGVRFSLKEMRSTFATLSVNNDANRMGAVSIQLRHTSTETTRRYYARINRREAVRKGIGDSWKENPITVPGSKPESGEQPEGR